MISVLSELANVALLVCHPDESQDTLLLCAEADHDSTVLSAAVGLESGERAAREIPERQPASACA
jgi:hypothetical protein